ncbi:type VII secretion-associated serine protease mycosin [Nocardia sp. NPDC055321]
MSGRFTNWARVACATAVLGAALMGPAAGAGARPLATVSPPTADLGLLGEAQGLSGKPAPLVTTEKHGICIEGTVGTAVDTSDGRKVKPDGIVPRDEPVSQKVLNLPAAWKFATGKGQKVAVIDSGVNRHPRLPALQAGGDYVADDSDGTWDCDGHGTLVAGIIAARPSPDDGFVGVAPDAEILSIRQYSIAYREKDKKGDAAPGSITDSGYGSTLTMAAAVVRAVDMGATVINISEVACSAASGDSADGSLGAAVRYAYERNVVVVVAAGNTSNKGCGTQNPGNGGWGQVSTVATPAWFTPYVLSVGSVQDTGGPSSFSLYGPWVGVAAVGTNIVSLDNKPGGTGLINGLPGDKGGFVPINGTSFAAPYVAGLAALIREQHPEYSAQQVMDRITRTAHGPGTGRDDRMGYGLIDPLAALTAKLPAQHVSTGADQAFIFPEPQTPEGPARFPRLVAVIGSIVCLAALGIGLAISIPFRRAHRDDELPDLD